MLSAGRLPEPFRTIDSLVSEVLDRAWNEHAAREARASARPHVEVVEHPVEFAPMQLGLAAGATVMGPRQQAGLVSVCDWRAAGQLAMSDAALGAAADASPVALHALDSAVLLCLAVDGAGLATISGRPAAGGGAWRTLFSGDAELAEGAASSAPVAAASLTHDARALLVMAASGRGRLCSVLPLASWEAAVMTDSAVAAAAAASPLPDKSMASVTLPIPAGLHRSPMHTALCSTDSEPRGLCCFTGHNQVFVIRPGVPECYVRTCTVPDAVSAFASNDRYAAVGLVSGAVLLFDLRSVLPERVLPLMTKSITSLAFLSPLSAHLVAAAAGGAGISLWTGETVGSLAELQRLEDYAEYRAAAPGAALVAGGHHVAWVVHATRAAALDHTGRVLGLLRPPPGAEFSGRVACLSPHGDGSAVAAAEVSGGGLAIYRAQFLAHVPQCPAAPNNNTRDDDLFRHA